MEAALKAISHPKRRAMLELVWTAERTATDIAQTVGLTKPAASQHLKVLRSAELVTVRVAGNHRFYRARADRLEELRVALERFWGARLETLRAELEGRS
jgi:DNA-binding transcriptional ArsR family regulator